MIIVFGIPFIPKERERKPRVKTHIDRTNEQGRCTNVSRVVERRRNVDRNRIKLNASRHRRPPNVHKLCQLHKLLVAHYGRGSQSSRPPRTSRAASPPHSPTHQYSLKAQLAECIAPRKGALRSSQSETLRKCHSSKFPRRLWGPGSAGGRSPLPPPA